MSQTLNRMILEFFLSSVLEAYLCEFFFLLRAYYIAYPKFIIWGIKNLSISCKANNITTGEKSIPDIGGSALLTKTYKGSHNSSINENIG
tara:strand:- start:40 stop:309 length:270 start_codon:yes stop_codon:yes gene_type:complete